MRSRRLGTRPPAVMAGVALLIAATAAASQAAGPAPGPAAATPAAAPVLPAVDQVPQLTADGVAVGRTDLGADGPGAAPQQVCDPGARWLRPRFSALDLRGGDTVTITGSAGGTYTFTGGDWPGRAFFTRAFEGSCATVTADLSDPDSSFALDGYQYGTRPLAETTVVMAGAGDICGAACEQTAQAVEGIDPVAVWTSGDNAYNSGRLSEYNENYDPTWGRFKDKTYPAPGNHEYYTSGGKGYYDYFNGVGNDTGRAGERGKGYYSYDVGDWHWIVLNSEISHYAGSTQEQWLRDDLAASTKPCTAAVTHHPRFSSGDHGDDPDMDALFTALYDGGADLLLTGHDHHYERFAPARPDGTVDTENGLRQFVIGTGGRALYSETNGSAGPSEEFQNDTFGVGRLELSATGYVFDFVPVAGRTYTDHVTGACHGADDPGPGPGPGEQVFADGFETDAGWTADPWWEDTARFCLGCLVGARRSPLCSSQADSPASYRGCTWPENRCGEGRNGPAAAPR